MRFFALRVYKMNILIVGNGFDLSHYLPTKYDHFMDVMSAIENKDTGGLPKNLQEKKIQEWIRLLEQTFNEKVEDETDKKFMSFEQLFTHNRDPSFIAKTKEFYLTENINLSKKDVVQLQYRLALNCWYQYFKDHVKEIKTWIDFEQKIEAVLKVFGNRAIEIENLETDEAIKIYFNGDNNTKTKISVRDLKILNFFKLSIKENMTRLLSRDSRSGQPFQTVTGTFININRVFCTGSNPIHGFNPNIFLNYLTEQLEDFIEIFNLYLELITNQLRPNCDIQIKSSDWVIPDRIYSFNYTNTYQSLYDNISVEYLHGACGEQQNIVLGISDLEDESLKKLKGYGFTKYHQKLFKDTHYLFLDN